MNSRGLTFASALPVADPHWPATSLSTHKVLRPYARCTFEALRRLVPNALPEHYDVIRTPFAMLAIAGFSSSIVEFACAGRLPVWGLQTSAELSYNPVRVIRV